MGRGHGATCECRTCLKDHIAAVVQRANSAEQALSDQHNEYALLSARVEAAEAEAARLRGEMDGLFRRMEVLYEENSRNDWSWCRRQSYLSGPECRFCGCGTWLNDDPQGAIVHKPECPMSRLEAAEGRVRELEKQLEEIGDGSWGGVG